VVSLLSVAISLVLMAVFVLVLFWGSGQPSRKES